VHFYTAFHLPTRAAVCDPAPSTQVVPRVPALLILLFLPLCVLRPGTVTAQTSDAVRIEPARLAPAGVPVMAVDGSSSSSNLLNAAVRDLRALQMKLPAVLPDGRVPPRGVRDSVPARPSTALVPLYFMFGGLQALDYVSTRQALSDRKGREENPFARPFVTNRLLLITAKAAATLAVIGAGEKLSKHHRLASVCFIAALDGAMLGVVAHNYRIK
jgi:hypothetical protein